MFLIYTCIHNVCNYYLFLDYIFYKNVALYIHWTISLFGGFTTNSYMYLFQTRVAFNIYYRIRKDTVDSRWSSFSTQIPGSENTRVRKCLGVRPELDVTAVLGRLDGQGANLRRVDLRAECIQLYINSQLM